MAEKERNLVHAGRKVGGTGYSIDQLRLNIGGKHETAYNQTKMQLQSHIRQPLTRDLPNPVRVAGEKGVQILAVADVHR